MRESDLQRLTDHVYWLPPGPPDRPALGAVVGQQYTVLLDGGASPAHARLFLRALAAQGVNDPAFAILTHWHWDHVFGAAALRTPVIAHRETARQMAVLAGYDWSDAALDRRVAAGIEIPMCANDIKIELPEPRTIQIIRPTILFDDTLSLDLGGVTCTVQHVGGDHAADSCVIHIQPDGVLFLGDCLYAAIYTPERHYTRRILALAQTILNFDAALFIEGHQDTVTPRAELEISLGKLRQAADLIDAYGPDETALRTRIDPADEDAVYYLDMLLAGRRFPSES
jgi:glyoxylase-like metal-dependent hydrolase (beta-lactamase superfamily II)